MNVDWLIYKLIHIEENNLKEIEIKFYASSKVLAAIRESQLLTKYSRDGWQSKELLNQYVDTEKQDLANAKVALRVRKDGNQYIQTLKAKGHSIGGLSERDEFDWFINNNQIDLSLLKDKYWPASLANLDKSKLGAIFSTDFIRDYIVVDWQLDAKSAQFEVAVDRGIIKTRSKQQPLNELELELKQGSVHSMIDFAIILANRFPLLPNDLSKAERGYRLLNAELYQFKIPNKPIVSDQIIQLKYYLRLAQGLLESYLWQPNLATLVSWIEHLKDLAEILLKKAPRDLLNLLDPILHEWQHNISIYNEDQLLDKLMFEVSKTRWGIFSLSVSRWLLTKV